MAKRTARFVCQTCGAVYPKWTGRCEACGEWNTIVEESVEPRATASRVGKPRAGGIEFVSLEGEAEPPPRITTGIAELDRVLGGGLVPASVVLVGGDPGIGKSHAAAAGGGKHGPRAQRSPRTLHFGRGRRSTSSGCVPAGSA